MADIVERLRDLDKKTANPPFWTTGICGEAADEIERLRDLSEKYKWQVRDTCVRAEKAEAEVRETRDILAASDVASLPKDYTVLQMAMDRMAELARLRAALDGDKADD